MAQKIWILGLIQEQQTALNSESTQKVKKEKKKKNKYIEQKKKKKKKEKSVHSWPTLGNIIPD